MSLDNESDYVELPQSPVILLPQDQNSNTPSEPQGKTPLDKPSSRDPSDRKTERGRDRVRERLDFGEAEPKKSRDNQAGHDAYNENKENFAVPRSSGPKQSKMPATKPKEATPRTPDPRSSAPKTPASSSTPRSPPVRTSAFRHSATVEQTDKRPHVQRPPQYRSTRGRSPVSKKQQQRASLHESSVYHQCIEYILSYAFSAFW